MLGSFVLYVAVWTVAAYPIDAALTFHLENSWAFSEAASSSLVLKDTHSQVDGTQVSSLRIRTVSANITVPQNEFLGDFKHFQQQAPAQEPLRLPTRDAPAPDVEDRETLVNLAKASWDAYYPNPSPHGWYDIDGFNWTSRFGWRPGQDGLRGHVFMSTNKQYGIIVFKGTTIFQLGAIPKPDTTRRDRLNNNLLFSCCCANVRWRLESEHPCQCNAGHNRCCSSCLADSLTGEDTYYKNAEMVVNYFKHKYPRTSFWLVGHSLGGSIASLTGMRFHLPTVTFEAPGERLAALRLGLVSSPDDATSLDYITHVYNNLDPLAWGGCKGALSLCAQAGYAMESICHAGRVAVYLFKGPKWTHPLIAHQIETVIAMLENENVPVPRAVPQRDCEDCPSWEFGDYPVSARPWWRRLLDKILGSN